MLTDRVVTGDCLDVLAALPPGCVDLAFADPPFNIGIPYAGGLDDDRPPAEYLDWLRLRLEAVPRVLSPTGTLYAAIGWQYQAEVCVLVKALGFHQRNLIAWHYTFGSNQRAKFTPAHTPIHYFVRDPRRFTFNADAVRVPSARQTVYRDKRAHPGGKVPDDVWAFPRVCGTFRERAKGHPCQMPLAVLERIVRASSDPGDLVLDPFCGVGTTLVAAKRLGRRYLGVEVVGEYAEGARKRLAGATQVAH